VGANWTGNDADCPGAIVIGNIALLVLNAPFPITVAAVNDKLLPPVFETITLCIDDVFAAKLPNDKEVGDTATCAGLEVTVTTTEADLVGSAALVAVKVYVPGLAGAV
jgi:hypothetical protein